MHNNLNLLTSPKPDKCLGAYAGQVPNSLHTPSVGLLPLQSVATLVSQGAVNVPNVATPFAIDHKESKHRYRFELTETSNPAAKIILYTVAKKFVLPPLLKLNANTEYEWVVSTRAPYESLDASLTEDEAFDPHDRDVYTTRSRALRFRTGI
jgi:hypothetical protein